MDNELKALVKAQIELKRKQELERIEEQIKTDSDAIDKAIELINSHTLYKKIDKRNGYVYQLATEEMFKYVDKLTTSLTWLEEQIRDKKKELELLNKNFPTLKKSY